jgi:hypothetical protein
MGDIYVYKPNKHRKWEIYKKCCSRSVKVRDQVADLYLDEWIIVKWVLEKWSVEVETGWNGSVQCPMMTFCERGNVT